MRNVAFYAATLWTLSLTLSACNVVGGNHQTDNERFRNQQNQNKTQIQQQIQMYAGGQPGKISVNGTVVQNNQIDGRIHIVQEFGSSQRLSDKIAILSTKSDDNEVSNFKSFSKTVDSTQTEKLNSDHSYVQIGCNDINASWTAELKEAKGQADNEVISANTVVICGKKTLTPSSVTILAHTLYLKGATLEMRNASGSLKISADKVFLLGSNKIETVGIDATSSVLPAASIELNILQGLFESGSLKLTSTGGTCKMP